MPEIIIFAGTTEGRQLAEFCADNKINAFVSSATEYGCALLPESEFITPLEGKMNSEKIEKFLSQNGIKLAIDATHPYAVEVSKNIKAACGSRVGYIRVKREETARSDYGKYFACFGEIADYLSTRSGRILLTTGSNMLNEYKNIKDYKERCTIRVLYSEKIKNACIEAGFSEDRIIFGKGPFSYEQNMEDLRKSGASFLVTKECGAAGGFPEKEQAARESGAELLILSRTEESGITVAQAEELLKNVKTD